MKFSGKSFIFAQIYAQIFGRSNEFKFSAQIFRAQINCAQYNGTQIFGNQGNEFLREKNGQPRQSIPCCIYDYLWSKVMSDRIVASNVVC